MAFDLIMDILQLYRDHNITYQTEGHKHCRPGWINAPCPFCSGNAGLHLGVTLDGSHGYCWRCGYHPVPRIISKLLNVGETKAKAIIREYRGVADAPDPKIRLRRKSHKLPSGVSPLLPVHKRYLKKRGFDPEKLERDWGLMGTGPVSQLDGIDYKHRIIVPVFWEGRRVTFQGRDITNRHPLKYLACPKAREAIHHKHLLYGKQEAWDGTGLCVEGVTDVWRLGPAAFCTFGVEYTLQQVRAIKKHFKRVAVIFDSEPQAQNQARKLVAELCFRGVDAFNVTLDNGSDPGSLTDKKAAQIVESIM